MLTCDEYLSPATLDEAFAAMAQHGARARLVAGATDILPWAREGRAGDVHIPVLIDIAAIPELNIREVAGHNVRLGAATPFQRFLDDHSLMAALPVMPFCAVWFADDQIRESATIGGNLVNASPAADGTPALLAHDARVVLAARRNGKIERRTVPLNQFFSGPGKTVLAADELLLEVDCKAAPGYGAAFEKVGHRRSLVISTVCMAALVELDKSGEQFTDVRLAVGGIGPIPLRLSSIESALKAKPLSAELIRDVAASASAFVASRTRKEYRREVTPGFVMRAILNATRRAGGGEKIISNEIEAAYA